MTVFGQLGIAYLLLVFKFALMSSLQLKQTGIIVVDHGSRVAAANSMLVELSQKYKAKSGLEIVEPAHMEMAEPTISTAFRKCVEQGATRIVCHPYFLSNGRHVTDDIPALMKQAATLFPGVEYVITPPVGSQDSMVDLISCSIEPFLSS